MNIVVTCYNCQKEFYAVITSTQYVRRCPHCFKLNKVRTIKDGKAYGEDDIVTQLAIESY
jgi:phage FluMu protein Com